MSRYDVRPVLSSSLRCSNKQSAFQESKLKAERMAYVIESKAEDGKEKLEAVLPFPGSLKDGTEVSLVFAREEHHPILRTILNGIIEEGNQNGEKKRKSC